MNIPDTILYHIGIMLIEGIGLGIVGQSKFITLKPYLGFTFIRIHFASI